MKILQLCSRVPYPLYDGGSIAMYNLADSMSRSGNNVQILAINTLKHYREHASIPNPIRERFNLQAVTVDTSLKPLPAFLNLFTSRSYNIERFISNDFKRILEKMLREVKFDIVQLESLYLTPYIESIRSYSSAKVVLRAHNAEFRIWERMVQSCPAGFKKAYLKLLSRRLKNYERQVLSRLDALVAITPEDKILFRELGCKVPVHVTPLGIDPDQYVPAEVIPEKQSLFHLGSMDWMPNIEAVQWFLNKVWPLIYENHPGSRLCLAGRNMPDFLTKTVFPGVTVQGEVKDAKTFMATKSIMVVPLLSGSGMRVKIIEGMAMSKTIISTSIGAEGIEYTDGENILIADTPEMFLEKTGKCMDDERFCANIGKSARLLVDKKYDNRIIAERLQLFYNELITG